MDNGPVLLCVERLTVLLIGLSVVYSHFQAKGLINLQI